MKLFSPTALLACLTLCLSVTALAQSEALVELRATEIAHEADAVVELPNFAALLPSGVPTILQDWEVATDTTGYFAVQPSITATGTLSYTVSGSIGSGSLRIRALDDTGYTDWTTVTLRTVAFNATGTLPLEPDTFTSQGPLLIETGSTMNIDTSVGSITHNATFDEVIKSTRLLVAKNGTLPGEVWRVLCVDSMTLEADATANNIIGDYGLAIIATGNITIHSPISFNGQNGSKGVPGLNGANAGHGTPGTNGGSIALIANGSLTVGSEAPIRAEGGVGGAGGDSYMYLDENSFPLWSQPGNGGAGGEGGVIIVSAYSLNVSSTLSVQGGNGGDGGIAVDDSGNPGGMAGAGGDGGRVIHARIESWQAVPTSVLDGGSGSTDGAAGTRTGRTGAYFLGPIADFRRQYNLSSNGSDDAADWSNDGVSNLMHYVFNLGDPNVKADPATVRDHMAKFTLTEGGHSYSWVEPDSIANLFVVLRLSDDLQNWYADLGEGEYNTVTTVDEGIYIRKTMSSIVPITDPARFFRIEFSDFTLSVFDEP